MTADDCKKLWRQLQQETIDRIDKIDKDTPFEGEEEPKWWLDMMDVRRVLQSQLPPKQR